MQEIIDQLQAAYNELLATTDQRIADGIAQGTESINRGAEDQRVLWEQEKAQLLGQIDQLQQQLADEGWQQQLAEVTAERDALRAKLDAALAALQG
jgi:hypothetical protein